MTLEAFQREVVFFDSAGVPITKCSKPTTPDEIWCAEHGYEAIIISKEEMDAISKRLVEKGFHPMT